MPWNIDTYIMTQKNRVVAVLKNLEDDSQVKTRVCQYKALKDGKGIQIAKQLIQSKITGQRSVLKKYGLRVPELNIDDVIKSLSSESHQFILGLFTKVKIYTDFGINSSRSIIKIHNELKTSD